MRKSRLSCYKQKKLIELFVEGSTARTAATHIGVNKNTASYYFQRLRQIICSNNRYFESFSPEIKSDQNYFADSCKHCHHYKGAQAHSVEDEISIFIFLKSNDDIFTVLAPDTKIITLPATIREKIKAGSIVSSNNWRNYHTMAMPEFNYSQANRLRSFWKQTKVHMRKFNGTPKEQFHLLLKEFAWRFNNPNPKTLFIQLNQWVKNDMG